MTSIAVSFYRRTPCVPMVRWCRPHVVAHAETRRGMPIVCGTRVSYAGIVRGHSTCLCRGFVTRLSNCLLLFVFHSYSAWKLFLEPICHRLGSDMTRMVSDGFPTGFRLATILFGIASCCRAGTCRNLVVT